MQPDRRQFLGGMGLAFAMPAAAASAPPPAFAPLVPDGRLPVNRERATRLMREAGIDALVGVSPANSFYATNFRSLLAEMGLPMAVAGIIPADPVKPVFAVLPSLDIRRAAASSREWPALIAYTAIRDADRYATAADYADAQPRVMPGWPANGALTPREALWDQTEKARPLAVAGSVELGVARALSELGLAGGTVAIDEPGLAAMLPHVGMGAVKLRPGDNFFLRLRQIKSAVEIDRMRAVARLNDGAAMAMIAQLRPGMTHADIEALFFAEVVRRGGRPEFVVAGMTAGLRSERLVAHEPFMVDCCGNFDGYSGDYARTIVLGTPPTLLINRSKRLSAIARALTAELRPGMRYSDISARGQAIAKAMGADCVIGVGPHSVGLTHSDDPWRDDLPFKARLDVTMEPGMVITIDMPTLEPGWGSMHFESLIVINKDGAEWLGRDDDVLHEVTV
ncbi:M24 family metallopeptidase [Polymorphobacter sp.]|uniref:M24 family metallopeptidase n=1 Tax=Polymorphobacter sp. TaxID=1909290 RepID=UPI003F7010F9